MRYWFLIKTIIIIIIIIIIIRSYLEIRVRDFLVKSFKTQKK